MNQEKAPSTDKGPTLDEVRQAQEAALKDGADASVIDVSKFDAYEDEIAAWRKSNPHSTEEGDKT